MKEIKFRYIYKRKEDGKLYQEIVPIECLEGRGDRPLALDVNNPYWDIIGRDEYTGLKDKNGKEIYEGDRVKWDTYDGYVGETTVEFREGRFYPIAFGSTPHRFDDAGFEVIGNIYENEELIK